MDSVCYQKLEMIQEGINKQLGFSYSTLDKLKGSNVLNALLNEYDIPKYLKSELESFLNIFNDKIYDDFPYLRKVLLHESNFVKIFGSFGYIISLYLDNKECYRVFPLFLKEMIDKFNLDNYKNLPIEEMLNKRMDLEYFYDPNTERNLVDVCVKLQNCYTNYLKYDEKIKNNTLNLNDQTEFFIWSEYMTYMLEYEELSKYPEYNVGSVVRWISKEHGDGYGFDVLSYDPISKRQKLIEVKSGKHNWMELTRNELKVLYEAVDNDCDYYIYRYHYNALKNNIDFYKLKYDSKKGTFIDINNSDNVFYISPYFKYENDYPKACFSIESEKEFKKLVKE